MHFLQQLFQHPPITFRNIMRVVRCRSPVAIRAEPPQTTKRTVSDWFKSSLPDRSLNACSSASFDSSELILLFVLRILHLLNSITQRKS